MQQPEKVTVVHTTSIFILPVTLLLSQVSPTHILTPTDSQQEAYNQSSLGQDHLGTTPRVKDTSYHSLTIPLRFFLFGNDELGSGQMFYSSQVSTVVHRVVLCFRISLTIASTNRKLLLAICLCMFVFMVE